MAPNIFCISVGSFGCKKTKSIQVSQSKTLRNEVQDI